MQIPIRLFARLTLTLSCALLFSRCDQPQIKGINAIQDSGISVRTECEECTDCCCAITLDDDTSVTLQLCGTEDGLSACTESDLDCNDPDLNGGGQFVVLTTATVQRHVFCMLEDNTLRIWNTSSTDGADITLTCQYDSGLPQILNIHLDATQMLYYDVESGCIIDQCNL
jgi:hypothetical protein